MKKSDGPEGTIIWFPYVGKTPLFDWVSIPARIFNTTMISGLSMDLLFVCLYHIQQCRMDNVISPKELKELTSRWLRSLEQPYGRPRIIAGQDTADQADVAFMLNHHYNRQPHKLSDGLSDVQNDCSRTSFSLSKSPSSEILEHVSEPSKAKMSFSSVAQFEGGKSPIYRRPERTGTGLLKRALLRWPSSNSPDRSLPPPIYTSYEPTFEDLHTATALLTSCTTSGTKHGRLYRLLQPFIYSAYLVRVIPNLLIHGFRPSVLLAVLSYNNNLRHGRKVSHARCMVRLLRDPAYKFSNSRDIVLASRILLTLTPPPKPARWQVISLGWAMFFACSVLVIGTELTIQWNDIQGVQNLSSVGQLIPFCVGVGGLVKVIWAAVMERDRREKDRWCYFGRCDAGEKRNEWKEAAEGFRQCTDAFEMAKLGELDADAKADV